MRAKRALCEEACARLENSIMSDVLEQIGRLKTRNVRGEMVPLGSLVSVSQGYGPDQVMHYNGFPAAEINGGAARGYSSGQAQAAICRVASFQSSTDARCRRIPSTPSHPLCRQRCR